MRSTTTPRARGSRRTGAASGSGCRATPSYQTGFRRTRDDQTGTDRARPDPALARQTRAGLYDEVTRRIVAQLEAGRVPWVQPWGRPGEAAAGIPRNAVTARRYSGINVLILWGAVIEHGYASQAWLTFRQAIEAGGAVRKGERGTTVVFAHRFVPETGTSRAGEAGDEAKAVPFLKRFTVFNVAQCEGLRPGLGRDAEPLPEREIVPVAESVIAASGIDFRVGGNRAFYVPALDYVQVPPQPAFFAQVDYYRTCLHELVHATGHRARLDRKLAAKFGTDGYAREELIAEIGSAFLCATLGIVPTVRHADYIGGWLDVLRADNRAIFRAASAATKAADWLLERHQACGAGDPAASGLAAPATCEVTALSRPARPAVES